MKEMLKSEVAALPQNRAERLCLSVARSNIHSREAAPRALLSAFCLLLFAFCFLPSAHAATWSRQTSGTMAWLRSVYFLDQNHGWVAGSNGTLLRTTDGGESWKKIAALGRDTLLDVYFASDDVGWLVVERDLLKLKTNDEPRSYLLKTEDGGFSWRRVFLKSDVNVRLVRAIFADNQHGWVFGETGIVYATRDGGEHWLRQASPTKHLLLGGAFVDYSRVWLVGAGATIVKTSDGGTTWQSGVVRNDANVRFTAASFVGQDLGWAVGAAGSIFKTIDGGRTWFAQSSNVDADLLDVKFIDAHEGWAIGSQGVLLHTNDGGARWTSQTNSTSHALQRLFFLDRNHGWAVGFGGTILRYGETNAPSLK
jgi:photosystem II stability/assembly factor-like uncharacterized protein